MEVDMTGNEVAEIVGLTGYDLRCLQALKNSKSAQAVVDRLYLASVDPSWLEDLKDKLAEFRQFAAENDDRIWEYERQWAMVYARPYLEHMEKLRSPAYITGLAERFVAPIRQAAEEEARGFTATFKQAA
jgi:hypothetical protein